jgi:hypothetical protein
VGAMMGGAGARRWGGVGACLSQAGGWRRQHPHVHLLALALVLTLAVAVALTCLAKSCPLPPQARVAARAACWTRCAASRCSCGRS